MKKGFTLAEIILTLAILGIIASLTIPELKNTVGSNNYTAKFRKILGAVEKARKQYELDHGLPTGRGTESPGSLFDYLNVAKKCINSAGCWHAANQWYNLCGEPVSDTDDGGYVLADGTLVKGRIFSFSNAPFGSFYSDGQTQELYFDLNGFSGPNTVGEDILRFEIYARTTLPTGADDTVFHYLGWYDSGADLCDRTCSSSGRIYGTACSYKVIMGEDY